MPNFRDKAQFYRSLGVMNHAGMSLADALRVSAKQSGYRDISLLARSMLGAKTTFAAALRKQPKQFSRLECELVALGEESGMLDKSFGNLAAWFELLQRTRTEVVSSLIYPLIILHSAPLLLGLPGFVSSGCFGCYLKDILRLLLPLYGAALFVLKGIPWVRSQIPGVAATVDNLTLRIPILGTLVTNLELARYSLALSYCIDSGMAIQPALRTSHSLIENLSIKRRLGKVPDLVSRGASLTGALASSKLLSPAMQGTLNVGELTGMQVQILRKIHEDYFAQFQTTIQRLLKVLPVLGLLIIGIFAGFKIIGSYQDMWRTIR